MSVLITRPLPFTMQEENAPPSRRPSDHLGARKSKRVCAATCKECSFYDLTLQSILHNNGAPLILVAICVCVSVFEFPLKDKNVIKACVLAGQTTAPSLCVFGSEGRIMVLLLKKYFSQIFFGIPGFSRHESFKHRMLYIVVMCFCALFITPKTVPFRPCGGVHVCDCAEC